MSQEVDLKDYRWGGMLSIWGQEEHAYQGVCYSGLAYNPHDYIHIIKKDAPPVNKWLVRYVDLELANDWLAYCINHILPDEVLKLIEFQRVHSKAHWPEKYASTIPSDEIIDEWDYDQDAADASEQKAKLRELQKRQYGGCLPWLKISFSQELPAKVMFAVGVLLRYASEHGPTLKIVELLPQLEPRIKPEHRLVVAMNLGGCRGHALSSWGYAYIPSFRMVAEKFSWKARFLKMLKDKPFYEQPTKMVEVDKYFDPAWKSDVYEREQEVYCSTYNNTILKRNGLSVRTHHNYPNELLALWDKKEK